MEIIRQTDLSREGNDCYINETVMVCKQFDLYFVLRVVKVVGWSDYSEVIVESDLLKTEKEANKIYKRYGGKL